MLIWLSIKSRSQACCQRSYSYPLHHPSAMNTRRETRNYCVQVDVNATCHWRQIYLQVKRATSALPRLPTNMNARREARNYCARPAVHATSCPPPHRKHKRTMRNAKLLRARVAVNVTCHWQKIQLLVKRATSALASPTPPHPRHTPHGHECTTRNAKLLRAGGCKRVLPLAANVSPSHAC